MASQGRSSYSGEDVSRRSAAVDSSTAIRVGFGCASLMQSPSGRHRQRLLAEAFERGIRHFDVARMYGLGAAERELGRFASGRREEIVIATKFGIEAAGSAGQLARLQAPARAVIARMPAARRALKRRSETFHHPHRYDPATARSSLETSLRELGTDYVDILFVHDPAPGEIAEVTQLSEALDELRSKGHIKTWGFAGSPEPCIALSGETSAQVLQVRDDMFDSALSRVPPTQNPITFSVLSGALGLILDYLADNPNRQARWTSAVGENCGDTEVISSLLLRDALERNGNGVVLFSTTHTERVKVAAGAASAALSEAGREPLQAFRELVLRELSAVVPSGG